MGISRAGGGASVGDVKPLLKATVPAGWLLCYGQAVSRATYAALFTEIGTVYGVGDGATTFNLPDLRGRALFGKDDMGGSAASRLTSGVSGVNGAALGAVGGGQSVTLTSAEIASHTHTQNAHSHNTAYATNASGTGLLIQSGSDDTSNGVTQAGTISNITSTTPTNQNTGGGGAHTNVPPAFVTNFIVKV